MTHVVGHTSQEARVASEMGEGGGSLTAVSPECAELAQLRSEVKACRICSEDSSVFHSFNDYIICWIIFLS